MYLLYIMYFLIKNPAFRNIFTWTIVSVVLCTRGVVVTNARVLLLTMSGSIDHLSSILDSKSVDVNYKREDLALCTVRVVLRTIRLVAWVMKLEMWVVKVRLSEWHRGL